MEWLGQIDTGRFLLFTLVLVRVSALVVTAPIYGGSDVPPQVRALLAFALAVLVFPSQWGASTPRADGLVDYLILAGGEVLVGLCLGLGVTILFSGIHLAGETVGRMGGLMVADIFDPTLETNVPLLSRLMFLVTLAVFVCVGGHRIVMAGLLDTFQTIPPGSGPPAGSVAGALVAILSQSFALGVRAALPAVTALLLATVVMGLIGRTLPQLNILLIGFSLNSMLMFAAVALTLGAAVWVFQEQLQWAVEVVLEALSSPVLTGPLS